jgi:site-specific DNA-methyltransferase (adenine-specific)
MINQIISGDALSKLKKIESESVDCVITSPPYYMLRDYGNDKQVGLEKTPQEYIQKLMEIFDQVKRVLKKTGTCFVVIADSYSGWKNGITDRIQTDGMKSTNSSIKKRPVLPRKSLMGIPERFMIAMLDHHWICRNEIIWQKPNVIPSSASDRFTVDFEKVYFFVKSRNYYFNQLKEPMVTSDRSMIRGSIAVIGGPLNQGRRNVSGSGNNKQDTIGLSNYTGFNDRYKIPKDGMRNMRSVWTISNSRNHYDHYAMFSPKLVQRLMDAGCPKNGIVLDPFIGSGTVALVAMANEKNYIGIELNQKYVNIANSRILEARS